MATIRTNTVVLTYDYVSDTESWTLHLTKLERSSTKKFNSYKYRTVRVGFDGKDICKRIAKKTPSVSTILKSYPHNGKATKADKSRAKKEHATLQKTYATDAYNLLQKDFNKLKSQNKLTFEFTRSDVDRRVVLTLAVFGEKEEITFTIPRQSGSTPSHREERKTIGIEDVNDGKNYVVNEEAFNHYGYIAKVVDFADVKDAQQLLELAQTYVGAQQFDDMSMTISAVDLHKLRGTNRFYAYSIVDSSIDGIVTSDGYDLGARDIISQELPSFNLLDEVRCISKPHGIDRTFPITEITIPLDRPEGVTYTMGKSGITSMSAHTANNAAGITRQINYIPSTSKMITTAKNELTALLNAKTTGYVNIVQENNQSQALIISNTPDWLHATKLWKWNMNGLGYLNKEDPESDGETYKLGMTMDGTIVADFVKTGVLEDGQGLNYWNMQTGEFRLTPNTYIGDGNETFSDIMNMASGAYYAENGSVNLLAGTDTIGVDDYGVWDEKTWIAAGAGTASRGVRDIDSKNTPNSGIKKYFYISPKNGYSFDVDENDPRVANFVGQKDVPLYADNVYTISCYIMGSGQLQMRVGCEIDGKFMYAQTTAEAISKQTTWKRYTFTFKAGQPGVYSDEANIAGLNADSLTNVYFGNVSRTRYAGLCICGMQLERSNRASDWQVNPKDDYALLETQIDAFKESLTQAALFKTLTNNGEEQGIYLHEGKIYINGTYIQTGTLNAGIITAGVLSDTAGKNFWNFATGNITTNGMKATNIQATGKFESTTANGRAKLVITSGFISNYYNNAIQDKISFTSDTSSNRSIMLRTKGSIRLIADGGIVVPKKLKGKNTSEGFKWVSSDVKGITGTRKFKIAMNPKSSGGSFQWTTHTLNIQFCNGLVIHCS